PLGPAATLPVRWKIVAGPKVRDIGVIAEGEAEDGAIIWPDDLPVGTHLLQLVDAASFAEEVPLLVAPRAAFAGDFDRCWLLAVQLYSVRSARNWGIGDFTDLEGLIALAAGLGADGVGLNPLHALFDDRPGDCSPYSPNSRLFLNPLYVDVEKLPGVALPADVARMRQDDVVDYPAAARSKWQALRAAFKRFTVDPTAANGSDFEKFRAERGSLLARFACFEALRHKFRKPWWEWPEQWRKPDEIHCARLREGEDAAEIKFVEFVQWVADRQLRDCRSATHCTNSTNLISAASSPSRRRAQWISSGFRHCSGHSHHGFLNLCRSASKQANRTNSDPRSARNFSKSLLLEAVGSTVNLLNAARSACHFDPAAAG